VNPSTIAALADGVNGADEEEDSGNAEDEEDAGVVWSVERRRRYVSRKIFILPTRVSRRCRRYNPAGSTCESRSYKYLMDEKK
jgi:hypothetical protein